MTRTRMPVAGLAAAGLAAGAAAAVVLRARGTVATVRRGRAVAARTVRYECERGRRAPALLALGDSLIVGVGAAHGRESVPGRFAAAFPGLTVHNRARVGARVRDLAAQLALAPRDRYQAVLVAAGANDVIRGTPLARVAVELAQFLDLARGRADLVVLLTSANVGGAPILPWYLRRLFTARSRRLRNLAAHACAQRGAHFVDLFAEPAHDPFRRDPRRYYGSDGLHPSSESYRICFERVRRGTPIADHLGGGCGHGSCSKG